MNHPPIIRIFNLVILLITMACTTPSDKADKLRLQTKVDTASYIIGLDYGIGIRGEEIEVNDLAVYKGLLDGLNGRSLIGDSVKNEIIDRYNDEFNNRKASKEKEQLEKTKSDGIEFLNNNKLTDGVEQLPDGLQYKALKAGDGDKPASDDMVKIHYRAMFIDRTVFDMTYDRGPAIVKLEELVKGLKEGILLMSPGSIYELYIPPELAYGDTSFANVIPAGSTLVYSIELIEIIKDNKK
jgi:FKBP-type peptidyl-prolyl cis-trans isomerase FklB